MSLKFNRYIKTIVFWGITSLASYGRSETFIQPYLLFIYVPGGWDQTMVLDPKIGVSTVSQETGAILATGKGDIPYVDHSSRPAVKVFFDTYGDQIAIINGVYSESFSHRDAKANLLDVGKKGPTQFPSDWLAYYASTVGGGDFPYVIIDAPSISNLYQYNTTFLTSSQLLEIYFADDYPNMTEEQTALISDTQITHLNNILANFESRSLAQVKLLSWRNNLLKLTSLRGVIKEQLKGLQFESSTLLRNGKFALNLFSADISRAVAISSDTLAKWDTHTGNYVTQSELLDDLFSDLKTLLEYAATKELTDNLTIIIASEFGRNPVISNSNGKGHWPYSSWLIMGPGLKGGTVIGLTDDLGRGVPISPLFGTEVETGEPLKAENIVAGIFLSYGVSYATLMGTEVLPLSVLKESQEK